MNKRVHLSINEQLLPKGAYWRYPLFAIPITHRDLRFRNTSLRALSFGGCG